MSFVPEPLPKPRARPGAGYVPFAGGVALEEPVPRDPPKPKEPPRFEIPERARKAASELTGYGWRTIAWQGHVADYSPNEQRLVRESLEAGATPTELALLHEIKATFDARIIE